VTTALAEPTTALQVDRKALLLALSRVERIAVQRSPKPILRGVRLHAQNGQLVLATADLDVSISTRIAASDDLPPCVVPCQELTRRIKAGKAPDCTLQLDSQDGVLIVNGGRVEHTLCTLPVDEFSPVPGDAPGETICVRTDELNAALGTVLAAVARDPSRYAIDGALLEADDAGVRFVATDGRRMVVVELEQFESGFRGCVILTRQMITLTRRLADARHDDIIALHIDSQPDRGGEAQPARIAVTGSEWTLSGMAHEGSFPHYRDVLPKSGKRFVVDRDLLLATLEEVALATDLDRKGVVLELAAEQIGLSAYSAGKGSASGTVPVSATNASSRKIRTAFDARLLGDAVKSLKCTRLVIDVSPNQRSKTSGAIIQRPALFYAEDAPNVRWVIMPVTINTSQKR
jgi:DNA polymerase-3 subunit beta